MAEWFWPIFIIVFIFLMFWLFPKILYLGTMVYYVLFKRKEEDKIKSATKYSIKELKELK